MSTHLTLELLREIQQGHRDPSALAATALGHLLELCPHCRRAIESWRQGEDPPAPNLAPARERMSELLALPTDERMERVRHQRHRYRDQELAELMLRQARSFLPGDLEGSYTSASPLRRLQGRFGESEFLYDRSVTTYREQQWLLEEARALISKSVLHRAWGDPVAALAVIDRAERLALKLKDEHPELMGFVRHNQSVFLREAGDPKRAREALATALSVPEYGDRWTALRLTWCAAELAREEGDLATAERHLLTARDGFVKGGIIYQGALAGKDLASLYAAQGRIQDVERIVAEIVPVFEEQEVHFEAEAARKILRDALGDRREVN